MAKWMLVDGFNLAFRAFYGMPELTRTDGFPTGALHGWVKSLWRLTDDENPAATLVFFDLGGSQDRLAIHPEYKAQRQETPKALVQQLPFVKSLTRAMGLVGIEQHGVESDDLLASQAVALADEGHEVLIVSADKDFAQVVDDRIKMLLPPTPANPKGGWRLMDTEGVLQKFGVTPAQIADYLALVGDTADNIPGLAGVGPKTAAKWLQTYGDLEGVIAHADEVKPDRFREKITADAERLRMNRQLTRFDLNLPTVASVQTEPQIGELLRLLEELEMKSTLVEARKRYTQPELF